MRKRFIGIFLFCLFLSIISIRAETNGYDLYWDSGTDIGLTATITSTSLDSGYHSISITVSLESLNYEAVDIHDVRVDFQIPGFFSSYVTFSTISSIGGSDQRSTSFQYSTSWGTNYLQLKLTCRENIPLAIDPELYTDWINFFTVSPYEAPTTPTDPSPSGTNGIDNTKLLPIILGSVGGVIGLGAIIAITVVLTQRRRKTSTTIPIQQVQSPSVQSLFCTNCGSELKSEDPFCSKCGAKKSS